MNTPSFKNSLKNDKAKKKDKKKSSKDDKDEDDEEKKAEDSAVTITFAKDGTSKPMSFSDDPELRKYLGI